MAVARLCLWGAWAKEAPLDNAAPHGAALAAERSRTSESNGSSARTGRGRNVPAMAFPDTPAIRAQLADAAERHAMGLRSGDSSTKSQLERLARTVLSDCNQ